VVVRPTTAAAVWGGDCCKTLFLDELVLINHSHVVVSAIIIDLKCFLWIFLKPQWRCTSFRQEAKHISRTIFEFVDLRNRFSFNIIFKNTAIFVRKSSGTCCSELRRVPKKIKLVIFAWMTEALLALSEHPLRAIVT
jgi:hypothetical protein